MLVARWRVRRPGRNRWRETRSPPDASASDDFRERQRGPRGREHYRQRQTDGVLRPQALDLLRQASGMVATVSTGYMTTPTSLSVHGPRPTTTTTTLGRPQAATARR